VVARTYLASHYAAAVPLSVVSQTLAVVADVWGTEDHGPRGCALQRAVAR